MNVKKVLAGVLSAILCVSLLAGCGEKNNAAKQTTESIDGLSVVATVNGREITMDEYGFFLSNAAAAKVYERNSLFDGNFSAVNWDEKDENGVSLAEAAKESALENAIEYALLAEDGKSKGVEPSAEELAEVDTLIEEYIAKNGEEMLNKNFRAMGVTTVEGYKKWANLTSSYAAVEESFSTDRSKYIDDEEKFKAYKDDNKVCAQHILIMNDSEKHENPEATIKEVLARAKNGEDFLTLMNEFNEDPGEKASGYSFGRGEMVPEFEEAAFALDYDEISDVVASDYGYHVIKRIVGLCEYTNYLKESADIKVDEEMLNSISVPDMMTELYNVRMELNAASEGSGNE